MVLGYQCILFLLGLLLNLRKVLSEQFAYSVTNETLPNGKTALVIELHVSSKSCLIDLYPNREFISNNYFELYQLDGTATFINRPKLTNMTVCHYTGAVRGVPGSWAAVNICVGFSGTVYSGHGIFYITNYFTVEDGSRMYTQKMMVHTRRKETDLDLICGNGHGSYKHTITPNLDLLINADYYVEMALVVDSNFYKALNSDMASVQRRCWDHINLLNAVYREFKVFIAITRIDVWNYQDKIEIDEDQNATMYRFFSYAEDLMKNDHHVDNVQMLTRVQFDIGSHGQTIFEGMCNSSSSFGIAYDSLDTRIDKTVATLAHALARNMGLKRDTKDCSCMDLNCIMWPSQAQILLWSKCSRDSFETVLTKDHLYCLLEKPVSVTCLTTPKTTETIQEWSLSGTYALPLTVAILSVACTWIGYMFWRKKIWAPFVRRESGVSERSVVFRGTPASGPNDGTVEIISPSISDEVLTQVEDLDRRTSPTRGEDSPPALPRDSPSSGRNVRF